jgi:hypothetical protein
MICNSQAIAFKKFRHSKFCGRRYRQADILHRASVIYPHFLPSFQQDKTGEWGLARFLWNLTCRKKSGFFAICGANVSFFEGTNGFWQCLCVESCF